MLYLKLCEYCYIKRELLITGKNKGKIGFFKKMQFEIINYFAENY